MWLCLHLECHAGLQQHSLSSISPMEVWKLCGHHFGHILSRCTKILLPLIGGTWPNPTELEQNCTQWLRWWWSLWQWFWIWKLNHCQMFGVGRTVESPLRFQWTRSYKTNCLLVMSFVYCKYFGYSIVKSPHYFITLIFLSKTNHSLIYLFYLIYRCNNLPELYMKLSPLALLRI